MKTSETLRAALTLLKTKGWTKGHYARAEFGMPTGPLEGDATCFCALGALIHTTRSYGESLQAESALEKALPGWAVYVKNYNDDARCEFKHVRALFGKAIKMCESRGD